MTTTKLSITTEEMTEIASTIVDQIGGRRALFMMGLKHKVVLINHDCAIAFHFTASKAFNYLKITYDMGADSYIVEFMKIRAAKIIKQERIENVYCDNLAGLIEEKTGLFLSL